MKYDVELWHRVLQLLQKSRGDNQLRTRQIVQVRTGKIFLERLLRGSTTGQNAVIITIGPTPQQTTLQFDGNTHVLTAFTGVEDFVAAATLATRGGKPHIRTYEDHTEYKPLPQPVAS